MAAIELKLQRKLVEILDALSAVDKIVNGHIGSFFSKKLWNEALPLSIIQELEKFPSLDSFIDFYFQFVSTKNSKSLSEYPQLEKFLLKPTSLSIGNDNSFVTNLNDLSEKFTNLGAPLGTSPPLKFFMSDKKKHEVERMVPLARSLSILTQSDSVVDIGGGKGYLSSNMAKYCGLKVLALDSSFVTTCGAAKLEKNMSKAAANSEQDLHKFQRDTVVVSRCTDLSSILLKNLGSTSSVGITGLHTCGDLAATSLHLFLHKDVRWLLNVGCCYHLIDEEFGYSDFWTVFNPTNEHGFPMSKFLTCQKARLGRNARMLASQPLDKILHNGVNEESVKSLHYRALLQVIIDRVQGHDLMQGHVGKLFSKCANFHDYIRKSIKKLDLKIELTDEEINSLYNEFAADEIKLRVFFLLRVHHAPLVETVILLDRLLFLLEQGIEHAYIVPLFDPTLSPRNHAIVAWKSELTNTQHLS